MHDGRVSIFDRHPRLRWAVPAAAGLLIVGGAALGTAGVSADAGLPPTTAEELLIDLQAPTADALSGTVEVTADLGLPNLSMLGDSSGSGLTKLASGTHTLRVWADGESGSRVDLLAPRGEYDIIRNGDDVWIWDSATSTVEHATVPKDAGAKGPSSVADLPATPQEAAALVLSSIEPTTEVTVSGAGSVAGRAVYELALAPKQNGSKIDRAVISVDAETSVPLRVRVFSTVTSAPAFEVGFTSVSFAKPDPSVFAFTPPPGAEVTELEMGDHSASKADRPAGGEPTMVGDGWTRVVLATLPTDAVIDEADPQAAQALQLLDALPTVSGEWGSGRIVDGTLFSAIITDDGRVAVGAVTAEVLEAALADR